MEFDTEDQVLYNGCFKLDFDAVKTKCFTLCFERADLVFKVELQISQTNPSFWALGSSCATTPLEPSALVTVVTALTTATTVSAVELAGKVGSEEMVGYEEDSTGRV